jgi:hypothetical protein
MINCVTIQKLHLQKLGVFLGNGLDNKRKLFASPPSPGFLIVWARFLKSNCFLSDRRRTHGVFDSSEQLVLGCFLVLGFELAVGCVFIRLHSSGKGWGRQPLSSFWV